MAFETRAIRESELAECIDLWCTVWPLDNSHDYFRKYFYGDVEWLPYYTQIGALDGRLVSAVHVCKRVVACGEYQLTLGGIANVATLPEYRGRGYNRRCLEQAVKVMEADAMDFSLLFTGIHAYYARHGYSTLSRQSITGTIRPDFRPQRSDYTVRPAADADLPAIYGAYAAYNAHRPIAVQRTPAYWRDWVGISEGRIPRDLYVTVSSRGTVCGYILCGTFRSAKPYSADAVGSRIIELAVDTGCGTNTDRGALASLLEAVTAEAWAVGRRQLRVDVCGAQIQEALGTILLDPQVSANESGMVRLLHRDNLLRSFSMVWNERWLAAGRPGGVIGVETPYGPVSIDANGKLLSIVTRQAIDTTQERYRPLSQAAFLGLLFGFVSPEILDGYEEAQPLLTALFPRRDAAYYGSDGY